MNVYFGKMQDATQCSNHICRAKGTEYFGDIQPDDYVFIRLAEDGAKESRLWKFNRIETDPSNNITTAFFDDVFSFNPISTEVFVRLKFFSINKNLVIFTSRQAKNVGFFKLELTDEASFLTTINSVTSFNAYTSNSINLREIVFVVDASSTESDKDIQIIKNSSNEYIIHNGSKAFVSGLQNEYQPNRYQGFCDFLNSNPRIASNRSKRNSQKKAKEWLENSGSGTITLLNLWDLFCSKVAFKEESEVDDTSEEDAVDEGCTSDEKSGMTTVTKEDYKNLIVYGIPGCGKSYLLKTIYLTDKEIIRTTFHPDYTNTDFIGQIKPVKKGTDLEYTVIPGPFSRALLSALTYPNKKTALVIEEINRGNAAAIFGDLFQLLDRNNSGESEYEIENEVISNYLSCNGKNQTKIKIPSNFYIYATMNTSDQNVFKLDTAFKRRWEFKRLTNKDTISSVKDFYVCTINGNKVGWKEFVETVNKVITNNDEISGDRQIGNFFYNGRDYDLERFANKVLEYLYNDVCKYGGKEEIFNIGKYHSFDEIYDAFINGENVFADNLFDFGKSAITTKVTSTAAVKEESKPVDIADSSKDNTDEK